MIQATGLWHGAAARPPQAADAGLGKTRSYMIILCLAERELATPNALIIDSGNCALVQNALEINDALLAVRCFLEFVWSHGFEIAEPSQILLCVVAGTDTRPPAPGWTATIAWLFVGGLCTSGGCCRVSILPMVHRFERILLSIRLMYVMKMNSESKLFLEQRSIVSSVIASCLATASRKACTGKSLTRRQAGTFAQCPTSAGGREGRSLLTWDRCRRYAFVVDVAKRPEKADFSFKSVVPNLNFAALQSKHAAK